ncbi:conserved hypothetical protein [Psychromonas ingrahamii 37]|uniref:DUF2999 domain-containing protein n=1 Tax=Psychromonas ingrahamii (strain DSM 17664 / CCUG 51855 / 37) TaxID=357804 RepID=A1SXB0_PSYIN|nr:DUF2999 domain-containing protein [Psychromonas ingrahamii]ABM04125.1 conserved hypothetical protein [Psychromonas ingrahamii 37]
MNPIIETLKDHNVTDEKITEVFEALTENPLAAMTIIQTLGIPQDKLQPLLMTVMTNPDLLTQAIEELNLDFSKLEAATAKLQETK